MGLPTSRHQFLFELRVSDGEAKDIRTLEFRALDATGLLEWVLAFTMLSESPLPDNPKRPKIEWSNELIIFSNDVIQQLAIRQMIAAGEAEILLPKANAVKLAETLCGADHWATVGEAQPGMVQVPRDSILAAVNGTRVLQYSFSETVSFLKNAPTLRPLRMHFRIPPTFKIQAEVCPSPTISPQSWVECEITYKNSVLEFTNGEGDGSSVKIDLKVATMSFALQDSSLVIQISDEDNVLFINPGTVDNFVTWAVTLKHLDSMLKGGNRELAVLLDAAVTDGHTYDSSSESEEEDVPNPEDETAAEPIASANALVSTDGSNTIPEHTHLEGELKSALSELGLGDALSDLPSTQSFADVRTRIRLSCEESSEILRTILQQNAQAGGKNYKKSLSPTKPEEKAPEELDPQVRQSQVDQNQILSLKTWSPRLNKSRLTPMSPANQSLQDSPTQPEPAPPLQRLSWTDRVPDARCICLELLSRPENLVHIGKSAASAELSEDFAYVVVHGIFSRYSQDSESLLRLLRDSIHENTTQTLRSLPKDPPLPASTALDAFTIRILREICRREEVKCYARHAMRHARQASAMHGGNDNAFATAAKLVEIIHSAGASALPRVVAAACHLLSDEGCSFTPFHLILEFMLIPAVEEEASGLEYYGIRPNRAQLLAQSQVNKSDCFVLPTERTDLTSRCGSQTIPRNNTSRQSQNICGP